MLYRTDRKVEPTSVCNVSEATERFFSHFLLNSLSESSFSKRIFREKIGLVRVVLRNLKTGCYITTRSFLSHPRRPVSAGRRVFYTVSIVLTLDPFFLIFTQLTYINPYYSYCGSERAEWWCYAIYE